MASPVAVDNSDCVVTINNIIEISQLHFQGQIIKYFQSLCQKLLGISQLLTVHKSNSEVLEANSLGKFLGNGIFAFILFLEIVKELLDQVAALVLELERLALVDSFLLVDQFERIFQCFLEVRVQPHLELFFFFVFARFGSPAPHVFCGQSFLYLSF